MSIITVITIIDDVDNDDDDDEFLKRKIGSEEKKIYFFIPLKVTEHCKQRLFNTTA